jgi:hypothetical protein
LYPVDMTSSGDLRVSSRGQMSLPAAARRRWRLGRGGEVAYLDLGDAVIIVPGGVKRLRQQLLKGVTTDDWRQAVEGFGDPDLANE